MYQNYQIEYSVKTKDDWIHLGFWQRAPTKINNHSNYRP